MNIYFVQIVQYPFVKPHHKYRVKYLKDNEKLGPIKIGKARNVERRLNQLQTACPYDLRLLAVIPVQTDKRAVEIEAYLHNLFRRHRVRGEWFTKDINVKEAMRRFEDELPHDGDVFLNVLDRYEREQHRQVWGA